MTSIRSPARQKEASPVGLFADLELEIGLERVVDSDVRDVHPPPNLYDLSHLETQQKKVVEIPRAMFAPEVAIGGKFNCSEPEKITNGDGHTPDLSSR